MATLDEKTKLSIPAVALATFFGTTVAITAYVVTLAVNANAKITMLDASMVANSTRLQSIEMKIDNLGHEFSASQLSMISRISALEGAVQKVQSAQAK